MQHEISRSEKHIIYYCKNLENQNLSNLLRKKGKLGKMCYREGFCTAYQYDFIVSLAMLNMPFTEKHQPRNKLISDKADAAV